MTDSSVKYTLVFLQTAVKSVMFVKNTHEETLIMMQNSNVLSSLHLATTTNDI